MMSIFNEFNELIHTKLYSRTRQTLSCITFQVNKILNQVRNERQVVK